MPVISEYYREQNRQLHKLNDTYGRSSEQWVPYIDTMIKDEGYASVLDYGCGKGELKARLPDHPIVEYDPAIEGKEAAPEPAELVVCTDVFEHIEPEHINAVLRDLKRVTKRKLFFSVACVPASKALPDGRNAHILLKPAAWWKDKIAEHFHIGLWEERSHYGAYGEAFPKLPDNMTDAQRKAQGVFAKSRRKMTPELAGLIELVKRESAKYHDIFSRIQTVRLWEGHDDQVADMQVVFGMFEHIKDLDAAMRAVVRMSRKGVLIFVRTTADRTEAFYKRLFEQHITVGSWLVQDGIIQCCGSPTVRVEGVKAVGVMDTTKRWEQVETAIKRFPQRVQPEPPHGRRAIIACYGPSLRATVDQLKAHIAEGNCDVISVSGSHDFLLQHGSVPTYHVECDPRLHKADNIDKAHPGVKYLIASCVHPGYFDKLAAGGADIHLWHVATDEHSRRLIDECGETSGSMISGGGSVGLRSIPLLYTMGSRDFSIFAMDCSFADEGKQQWAGKHAGKVQTVVTVECNERIFASSPVLLTYATNFFETVQKIHDCSFRLYGDGLLQSMSEYYSALASMEHVEAERAA